MGLRDQVVDGLRSIFGAEREARVAAESPSVAAMAAQPSSMFAVAGRDDIGGMLSVSQVLMDKIADYEAMEEYPSIGCLAEGTLVYVVDQSVVTPTPIEKLATDGDGALTLGFDLKKQKIVKIRAQNPRLSSLSADVLALPLSNGRTIKATPDHKFLTTDGYIEAKDLKKGAQLVAMRAGFSPTASTFLTNDQFGRLELLSDPTPAGQAKVYDVTTATHNFVAEGVVVHNSAFRYFAGDAVQPSITDGRVIWPVTDDDAIQGITNDLLHKRLRVEYEILSQAYTLVKYGQLYEESLVTDQGVVGLNHLPVPTVRRVEALDGGLIGYVQDITGQFTANGHELRNMLAGNVEIPKSLALFEDWQVNHFRLRSTSRRSTYGVSVADGSRWVWKRLVMLEDIANIYRLQRIPRYVWYVDVTDVPTDKVEGHLRKLKFSHKKRRFLNPQTGRQDARYKPISVDEDVYIAVAKDRELAKLDVVASPGWNDMEDINYWKRALYGTLNVPKSWMGEDEDAPGRGPLSNSDVRAARVTLTVQQELKLGYERIARIHLAARGMKDPFAPELTIQMTVPSGIYELAAYEVLTARADYAQRIMPFTSVRWIQENVLHWGESEINMIEKQRKKEAAQQQAAMGGGPPPPGGAPSPMEPPPPALDLSGSAPEPPNPNGAPQEWRQYDRLARLEEMRYQQSNQNHAMILDKLGRLIETQPEFAQAERERRMFLQEFKKAALHQTRAGYLHSIPSGQGRSRMDGDRMNGDRHR